MFLMSRWGESESSITYEHDQKRKQSVILKRENVLDTVCERSIDRTGCIARARETCRFTAGILYVDHVDVGRVAVESGCTQLA